ncbi:MAG: alanine racemase [Blastocatellia bacterium]
MKDEKEPADKTINAAHDSSLIPHPSSFILPGRPTWAEINLDNLVHNFRLIKKTVGAGVAIMAALKADAYGHGAVSCALALEGEGADWFGVALPEEGLKLRDAGVTRPVLCLGGFWEGQEDTVIARSLTPVLFRLDLLERFNSAARAAGVTADYHLKIDTGMRRLGVLYEELEEFLAGAAGFENVRLDGLMTHFAAADDPEKAEFTRHQITLFESAVQTVRNQGYNPTWIHEANSAAILAYEQAHGNLIRPGGLLYGVWRDATIPTAAPLDWRPVLSLHSRIVLLKAVGSGVPIGYGGTFVTSRPSLIATLAIGYEDGMSRALSNKGRVIVRGQFAPIVGRISMDLTIIDVTDVADVRTGDEVVIIGTQAASHISAEDIAGTLGTISYEVTCRISERVPKVIVGSRQ